MMNNKNLKYLICLLICYTIYNCSSAKGHNEDINSPTKKFFIIDAQEAYKTSGYLNEKTFNDYYKKYEEFNLDRIFEARRKALDSLKMDDKDNFSIIDVHSHNFQGEYDVAYLFYGDSVAYYYMPQIGEDDFEKFQLFKYHKRDLLKTNQSIIKIVEDFKLNNKINLKPHTQPLTRYYITSVQDKKVHYYRIKSEDFKVTKLK